MKPACLLLLIPLLGSTARCTGVQEADAGITPDAVPDDFEAPDADAETIQCFHRALADDGDWERRKPFGDVWAPRVPEGWRPYTQGNWVETDQGWGWEAEEPWGWATFHYGRWFYGPERKWLWIPGTRWAPAWVAWRWGGGYVGWAPLPPSIGFLAGRGLDAGSASIHASHFYFVPESALLSHNLRSAMIPANQNATLLGKTRDITHYSLVRHRVFNLGVSPRRIAGIVGHPLAPLRVARLAGRETSRGFFYQPPELKKLAGGSWREFGNASIHRSLASARTEEGGGRGIAEARTHRSRGEQEAGRLTYGIESSLGGRRISPTAQGSDARRRLASARGAGRSEPYGLGSKSNHMGGQERVSAAGPRTSQDVQSRSLPVMREQRATSAAPEAFRSQTPRRERFQGLTPPVETQRGYSSAAQYQAQQPRNMAPAPSQRGFMSAPPRQQAHEAPSHMSSGGRHRPP